MNQSLLKNKWLFILGTAFVVITIIVLFQKYFDLEKSKLYLFHYNEGLRLQREGNRAGAIEEYLQAKQINPNSSSLLINLADVQIASGQDEAADSNLILALILDPENAKIYGGFGVLASRKGQPDSAIVLFRRAIEYHVPNASNPNELGSYYVHLAEIYDEQSKFDSAEAAYNSAMLLSPLLPEAFYGAANFYASRKLYLISDSLYIEADLVRPQGAIEQYLIGMTYIDRGMYAEATSMMLRVLKKDNKYYRAWYTLASIYDHYGEPKDSVNNYLEKCLELEPNFEPALELKKKTELRKK